MDFEILKLAFDELDFQCVMHHVETGDDAMALLNEKNKEAEVPWPDIALLDINNPGMSGQAVLSHMKYDSWLRYVPAITITSSRNMSDVMHVYENWGNGYINKGKGFNFVQHLEKFIRFWFSMARLPTGTVIRPGLPPIDYSTVKESMIRIFCIEDCEDDAEILRMTAKKLDFAWPLRYVDTGEAALDMIKKKSLHPMPDLILLDINLPGMDGIKLLEELKMDPETRTIQVFAYSGTQDVYEIAEVYRRHVNAFIPKPQDMHDAKYTLATIAQWFSILRLPRRPGLQFTNAPFDDEG